MTSESPTQYFGDVDLTIANPKGIEYQFAAADLANNSSLSPIYFLSRGIFTDHTPPSIVHAPIGSAREKTALLFAAEVTDNIIGVSSVKLIYWYKEGEVKEIIPQTIGENIFGAALPADEVVAGELKYFISAKDGRQNRAETPVYTIRVSSSRVPSKDEAAFGCAAAPFPR